MIDFIGKYIMKFTSKNALIIVYSIIISSIVFPFEQYAFGLCDDSSPLSFRVGNKWGYIDKTGKTVIKPRFDRAFDFVAGRAFVKENGLWGIIDKNSGWVAEPSYDDVSDGFLDGTALVSKDGRYYFIDGNGKTIAGSYDDARNFWEGLGRIQLGDKWGFIDKKGKMIIPTQFDHAGPFSDGMARVVSDNKVFYINNRGQKILELPENMVSGDFSEGLALFEIDGNGVQGYINAKGEIVFEPLFREAGNFVDGRASVVIDGRYGFIDKEGKLAIPAKYDKVEDFSDGFASVRIGQTGAKFGYIDRIGNEVIPFKFDLAGDFKCGIAYVEIDNSWGYIDKKGRYIFMPRRLN